MLENKKERIFSKECSIVFLLLVVTAYLLTPRGWEPGADTYKMWFASRLLTERFEFPLFSHGPLYVLYLSLFRLLEYPISFYTEYSVTHLFCYFSIYLLLRRRLVPVLAFLLVVAWIPFLATVEGAHVLFGMGFISLYLRGLYDSSKQGEWVPLSLACAALSHPVYSLFLVGHVLGLLGLKWFFRKKKTILYERLHIQKPWEYIINGSKLFLLLLTLLIFLFPAKHPIYNHLGGNEVNYAPISLKGFNTAFFQIGLHREIMRTIPESEWMYQDWYFTKKKIYGDADNFIEAAINNPQVFFTNIVENIIGIIPLAKQLLVGYSWTSPLGTLWSIFSYILMVIGLINLTSVARKNRKLEYIAATLIGTIGLVTILFLTWFNTRYSVLLLPFTIMLVSHMPSGMTMAWNKLKNLPQEITEHNMAIEQSERRIQGIGLFLLVVLGLLAIPILPVLWKIFPPQKVDRLIFGVAIFIIIEALLFFMLLRKPVQVRLFLTGWFDPMVYKCPSLVKTGFILAVVLVLLWNAPRPFEAQLLTSQASIGNWLRGRFLLQGEVSMSRAYQKIMEGVDRENTRILTPSDSIWALGLANLRLDGVHTFFLLPPFKDDSGDVEKFLNNLDEIWINKYDANPSYDVSTQNYLRYKLHIEPFLEGKINNGWVKINIKNFGIRYKNLKSI